MNFLTRILPIILSGFTVASFSLAQDDATVAQTACRIRVVDDQSGWPVPLVELRTTNHVRFVSDNAGVIAIDDPSLLDREVYFSVVGHGYEVPADGFGFRGVRLTPRRGETRTVKVHRTAIAKRVGRLTGAGLFVESQKLGDHLDWHDAPIFGCDTVQNAVHRGKMYWAWGDTRIASYPLGIFAMTSGTTSTTPFRSLQPPLKPKFDLFLDPRGRPKGVAAFPGDGPTWLTGYVSLSDQDGKPHLVAFYRKIKGHLQTYEAGLCEWNDSTSEFEIVRTVWKASEGGSPPSLAEEGHPAFWTDAEGTRWLLFGNPLPRIQVQANYEAWKDYENWKTLTPQKTLRSADDDTQIVPHSGSIVWNAFRKRWVTVFMQKFGKPSAFGTLWYAEADSPMGPWGTAVEILSHDNYTFYNPRLHPNVTPQSGSTLLFEGTYTAEFANHAEPTPYYDYNQILYRLDLDDPALQPAQSSVHSLHP
ncbi:hypothetical protein [Novipirellula caenicola]|uniref:hypothetical protein n=1 Tax=Novipirellula caenicola TaxID=1536901 RepID=UPI0031E7F8C8